MGVGRGGAPRGPVAQEPRACASGSSEGRLEWCPSLRPLLSIIVASSHYVAMWLLKSKLQCTSEFSASVTLATCPRSVSV